MTCPSHRELTTHVDSNTGKSRLAAWARRSLAPAAVLLAALSSGCAASVGPSPDLRLRHVILYQNGIGYFERTGVLREERLRLQFREHEIDDVLKSLVVVEEGLGASDKPSTVSALLPQAKEKSGSEEKDGTTSLDVVLSPRTARSVSIAYAVPTAAWKATYRIILPDPSVKPGKGALLQAWALIDNVSDEDWNDVKLTLATGAPLSFASNIRAPRFVPRPDAGGTMVEPIATGPVMAERVTAQDRDGDGIKDSYDRCPGDQEDRDGFDDGDGCPDTDNDHDGIADASDVCPNEPGTSTGDPGKNGCPQYARKVIVTSSQIQILRQVRFERDADVVRPVAQPLIDEVASVLKQHPEITGLTIEGHASNDERDVWGVAARRAGAVRAALIKLGVKAELSVKTFGDTRPIAANSTDEGRQANRRAEFRLDETSSAPPVGTTKADKTPPKEHEVGAARASAMDRGSSAAGAPHDVAGAVRYDITNAISIPRQSSTLVTIVNEYVPGEDVFLFRPDQAVSSSTRYPFRAARIESKGDLGLQGGAGSVFAGGTFAGEGILGKLNPGEAAMIPYAIDSSTEVKVGVEHTEVPVRLIALARGVMTVENSAIATTRYEIATGKSAPSRMFIRHDRRQGYTVKSLPPLTETTADAYLIPIPLTAGRPSVLTVEEREPRRQEITIVDAAGLRLGLYLDAGGLAQDIDKRVREIIALRVSVGKIEEQMEALRSQLGDVGKRSGELRESLRAIEKTPSAAALQRKLMDRLAEATTQGEQLSAKLIEQGVAHAEARAKLSESLRDLAFETKADPKP
jgi:outer membrane protein OmpA-like peptidoglycan-associated protein